MSSTVLRVLLEVNNQLKLFHWQTQFYSRHKASDDYIKKLTELTDKFLEVYQGKYGKLKLGTSVQINLYDTNDNTVIEYVRTFHNFLENDLMNVISSRDSDLTNIRDELLGETKQFLYLLNFS